MSNTGNPKGQPPLLGGIAELRREFDESFALPRRPRESRAETFLMLRTAGYPLALRLVDLARVEVRRKVVPLPAESTDLVGLAGVQSRLVPVYDLALLLGVSEQPTTWQWIALCAGAEPLGLAFEALHGYLRVAPSQVGISGERESPREHLPQVVREGETAWQIVEVPSLVAAVRRRAGGSLGMLPET